MKIAVIDKKDIVLKIENSSLKFDGQNLPLRFVDMLILNHRITLSTKDILTLTKENISVLVISYNNSNFSIISSANSKNSEIKQLQYNSLQNRLKFAKYFIEQKIVLHKEQLQMHGVELNINQKLLQLRDAKSIDEIMGIEGAFASLYFKNFFLLFPKTMHKGKRSKQPPQDPVNALLSYWYSLYYNIITIKLLSYGFEPSMGYLHTPFRSHNALASDILELFRADINQAVVGVFKSKLLVMEDFSKKGGVYLKYEGRKKVWKEFTQLVDVLEVKLNTTIAFIKKEIANEKI